MTPADILAERIANLRAKKEVIQATPAENLKFYLSLALKNKELHYPNLEPLLAMMEALAPNIKELTPLSLGHEAYSIRCPNCGSHQGWCYTKPLRTNCCAGSSLIDEYLLTRIQAHFELSVAQWRRMDLIYNSVLEDYYDYNSFK